MNLKDSGFKTLNELVLIDTWWNVNINFSGKMAQMSTVLIDTWWNVNKYTGKLSNGRAVVLIDTWWNVNTIAVTRKRSNGVCFNRYMVECEYICTCKT